MTPTALSVPAAAAGAQGPWAQLRLGTGPGTCSAPRRCATLPAMRRFLLLVLLTATAALAGCGSGTSASDKDPRAALAGVKPLPSAQVDAALRVFFDHAPASVGDQLELTFKGPLRNNGPDKLPSLDWKVAFAGLTTRFTSRIVSTGDDAFIILGGQDFEVGREAIARLAEQARGSTHQGFALNPLSAVKDVEEAGRVTVAGVQATRYTGTIDLDRVMDQYERLSQSLTTQGAAQAVPHGHRTPEQRAEVKRTFARPRFDAAVASDRTVRRLAVTTRFTTPPANREAAGGITGGRIEYRVEYSGVGGDTRINPPAHAQPIADFARALQQILSRRG
jgi:hypothetical protein